MKTEYNVGVFKLSLSKASKRDFLDVKLLMVLYDFLYVMAHSTFLRSFLSLMFPICCITRNRPHSRSSSVYFSGRGGKGLLHVIYVSVVWPFAGPCFFVFVWKWTFLLYSVSAPGPCSCHCPDNSTQQAACQEPAGPSVIFTANY